MNTSILRYTKWSFPFRFFGQNSVHIFCISMLHAPPISFALILSRCGESGNYEARCAAVNSLAEILTCITVCCTLFNFWKKPLQWNGNCLQRGVGLRWTSAPESCVRVARTRFSWTWSMFCMWRLRIRMDGWMNGGSSQRPRNGCQLWAAKGRHSFICHLMKRKYQRIRRKTQSKTVLKLLLIMFVGYTHAHTTDTYIHRPRSCIHVYIKPHYMRTPTRKYGMYRISNGWILGGGLPL